MKLDSKRYYLQVLPSLNSLDPYDYKKLSRFFNISLQQNAFDDLTHARMKRDSLNKSLPGLKFTIFRVITTHEAIE